MRPSTTPWILAASALLVVAGCSANRPAPATAAAGETSTETTAAEVAGPSSDEAPAAPGASGTNVGSTESPLGPLVCRATVPSYGTIELYTKWEGAEGAGLLRRVAPSGMRYEQRIRAERQGSLVIADDPNAKDITAHAAILRSQNGKTFVRLGEGPEGTYACE